MKRKVNLTSNTSKIVDEKTKQKRSHVVLLVDCEHVNKPFELVNVISASTLRETYESLKKSKSKKTVKTEKAITQTVYTRTVQSVNIDEAKDIIANGYKDFTIFIPKELPMNTSTDKLDSALLFKLFKMESKHYNPMVSVLKNEKYTYMDYMLELLKPYMVLVELDDFRQMQSNGDLHPKYPILFQMIWKNCIKFLKIRVLKIRWDYMIISARFTSVIRLLWSILLRNPSDISVTFTIRRFFGMP